MTILRLQATSEKNKNKQELVCNKYDNLNL